MDLTGGVGLPPPLPADGTARPIRRRITGALSTGVLGVLTGVLVVLLASTLLGYRAFTIESGSMTPTIAVGDVVIDQSVSPLAVRPGAIVTFRDPDLDGQLVTHRVMSVRRSGNRVLFVTKGDANVATEHWNIVVDGRLGREWLVVAGIGHLVADIGAPLARVIEVALGSLALAWIGLAWIWRRPQLQGERRGNVQGLTIRPV